MRNLKRVLSLALACVMVIGMMVMTTGAADFGDVAEIKNTEAVEVMSAIEVLEGDEFGNYNPTEILTREQAAKIICAMLMGKDNADKLSKNQTIFQDVAAGRWSAGYIAYCANLGIISGYEGNFNPTDKLTAVAFGKMLLVALGYNADTEGYVGDNWATNIAVDMMDAGLDVKNVAMDDELTRDNAAQMAFQALTATLVDYTTKTELKTGTDTTVTISGGRFEKTWGSNDANTYDYTTGTATALATDTIQFCEKYFDKLEKVTMGVEDDFGRPAHQWLYDNELVSFVVKKPVATLTGATRDVDVAKALSGYKLSGTDGGGNAVAFNINDTAIRTFTTSASLIDDLSDGSDDAISVTNTIAEDIATLTANGLVYEFYDKNRDKVIDEIVKIQYTVGDVEDIYVDEDQGITTYTIDSASYNVYEDEDDIDEIAIMGTVAEKDFVTYVAGNSTKVYVYPTTSFQGAQGEKTDAASTIVVDGTTYKVGTGIIDDNTSVALAMTKFANSDATANYYVDQNGYVVWTDIKVAPQYAVVDAIAWVDGTGVNAGDGYAEAKLAFADGTTKIVEVSTLKNATYTNRFDYNDTPSLSTANNTKHKIDTGLNMDENSAFMNMVVTYSVNKQGKYDLVNVTDTNSATVTSAVVNTKGDPTFTSNSTGPVTDIANNGTIYLVKTSANGRDFFNAYTGYKNVPSVTAGTNGVVVAYAENNLSKPAFVYINASSDGNTVGDAVTGDMLFVTSTAYTTIDNGNDTYYTLTGIVNGIENVTIKTETESIVSGMTRFNLYELVVDGDGFVTGWNNQTDDKDQDGSAATSVYNYQSSLAADAAAGVIDGTYSYDGSETVYVIKDGKIIGGNAESAKAGDAVYIKVIDSTGTPAEQVTAEVIYIVK